MAADESKALSPTYHRVQATMISLARFKNEKNIFFYFEKRHSFLEKNDLKTDRCLGDKKSHFIAFFCPSAQYTIRLLDV
jgi:hypothetical protein